MISSSDEPRENQPYEPPVLGPATPIAAVTLFSGTVNPDGGTVDFGD